MDELASRAVAAAVEVAQSQGLGPVDPVLLKDGSNAIIHLAPASVVARVPTTGSLIRHPAERWLQRDLEIAAFLEERHFPVVAPAREIAAKVHLSSPSTGSMAMTFWTYVEHDRDHTATDEEAAEALRGLHVALRGYEGALPFLGVLLEELPHWLRWLERYRQLSGAEITALRQAHWSLASRLRRGRSPLQALHGDAHAGNLLRTARGLLWTDFEDACVGPVAWDVATLVARRPDGTAEMLDAYGDIPGAEEILTFIEARELEAAIYMQVLARRFPQRKAEAANALAEWHRKWAE